MLKTLFNVKTLFFHKFRKCAQALGSGISRHILALEGDILKCDDLDLGPERVNDTEGAHSEHWEGGGQCNGSFHGDIYDPMMMEPYSVNTNHFYNICTMLDQRRRCWATLNKCYANVLCFLGSAAGPLCIFMTIRAYYIYNSDPI